MPPNTPRKHLFVNTCADVLADKGAAICQLPLDITTPILYKYKQVTIIQRRLTRILINLPHRVKPATPEAETDNQQLALMAPPTDTLNMCVDKSNHSIEWDANRLKCKHCTSSMLKNNNCIRDWLASPCLSRDESDSKTKPVNFPGVLHISKRTSHASHSLKVFKGFVYCQQCGSHAGKTRLRKLAGQCDPPTGHGRRVLEALNKGHRPAHVTEWPDP